MSNALTNGEGGGENAEENGAEKSEAAIISPISAQQMFPDGDEALIEMIQKGTPKTFNNRDDPKLKTFNSELELTTDVSESTFFKFHITMYLWIMKVIRSTS
jgi:hypothetical protein